MHVYRSKYKLALALVCLISLWAACPLSVQAEVPYSTFTKDSYDRTIYTQPAYAPSRVIARDIYIVNEKGEQTYSPLKRPQGIYIDNHDEIYISDTDNNRIVQFSPEGEVKRVLTIPDSPLNQPQGIFVADNGDIYIADTGNKRIVRLNKDGELEQQYARPESRFINESFIYEPTNMVVDQRGFIYVVSNGSYQGIVQLDPEGDFYGFFGTNATDASLMDKIRAAFYSKEQLSRQVRLLPSTIRNIDIDADGFIYSVSGSSSEQVKKLNIRGDNLWKGLSFGTKIPDTDTPSSGRVLADITVDHDGNMTVIDKTSNVVLQYDSSGKLLFYWRGPVAVGTPQVGINQSPVAVATNSKNELFILDDALNLLQVFKPTEFGTAVHQAYSLTQQGKYQESEDYWNKVVKLNALYSPAYKGLAQAAFYNGDYDQARELYELAGDSTGYSDAYWQLRLQWFQRHFPLLANCVLVVAVLAMLWSRLKRMLPISIPFTSKLRLKGKNAKLIRQLKHAFFILKHPLEGFSDLRYLNRGGYLSAFILLLTVVIMLLVKTYYTSFTFNPIPVADQSSSSILTIFIVTWFSWVVCNYLIGAIYQGEARFKDVFVGSSYSLLPIAMLGLPLALVSNVMTMSESSIYHALESVMVVWSGLLFFWNIQSLQNYSFGETVINVLLTAFSMIVLWVLIFIFVGLSSELLNFTYTIYQEVTM
ncbi:YIP1 family protein [Paenibacillus mendelii]|uniref:YIP1 family protein n=1 Tax=Paenibacillus mendelii TaxID=206163 RepID=A0ABV6JKB9_9BACL|nr:YIP1 family protein [Paenibacillus mendelii]MCQ6559068.1 YIP1 family protein [Paenibacillus mendelii]